MWETLISPIAALLEQVLPDPKAAADAKLKLMELAQQGQLAQLNADLQMATGQMDTNKVEASNPTLFVSGWRPFIGWVCGAGCAWNWIGLPVSVFVAGLLGQHIDMRPADLSEMMPLLMGMLGMGAMRSFEKVKGVAAK